VDGLDKPGHDERDGDHSTFQTDSRTLTDPEFRRPMAGRAGVHGEGKDIMSHGEIRLFRVIFVVAAIWNLCGGLLGYLNPSHAFELLFDRRADDPVLLSIFQGAAGTTFTYFFGYMFVALNPLRHSGIVIIGGIGKVGFALQMWKFYAAGLANANALIIVIGDMIFFAVFLYYFYRLIRAGNRPI